MRMNLKTGFCLLLAAVVLTTTACPEAPGTTTTPSGGADATLKSITIAGTAPESLGEPAAFWDEVEPADIYLTAEQMTDAAIAAAPTAAKAAASYAVTANIYAEPEDFDSESVFTLADGQVLWVRITNGKNTLIYAFVVRSRSGLNSLSLTRSGTTPRTAALGSSADSWDAVTETGELLVGTAELAGKNPAGGDLTLGFAFTPTSGITATYAVAKGDDAPDFTAPVTSVIGAEDGDWLYVRSVRTIAGNETLPLFYKIKIVEKDDNLTLTSLTLNSQAVTLTAADSLGWNNFNSAAVTEVNLSAMPADQIVAYSAAAGAATTTVGFGITADGARPATFGGAGSAAIPSGSFLCLELVNELGEKGYYRVRVIYGNTEAVITGVTVGGKAVTPLADPGTFDDATANQFTGTVSAVELSIAEAGDGSAVTVAAANASAGATVEYTWGASYAGNLFAKFEDWKNAGTGLFAGGGIDVSSAFGPAVHNAPAGVHGAVIFIRVTSESRTVSNVYAIRCSVALPADVALSSVTVGGVTAAIPTPGSFDATQGFLYNGAYGSVTLNAAAAGDGSEVMVVAAAGGGTVTYSFGLWLDFGEFGGLFGPYDSAVQTTEFPTPNTSGEGLFDGTVIDSGFFGNYFANAGVDGAVIFIKVASVEAPGVTATYAIRCSVEKEKEE